MPIFIGLNSPWHKSRSKHSAR